MNFLEIVNQVINDTNRPDMGLVSANGDGRIPNAVFASTLAMHTMDFFWRDIATADVVFDQPLYIQTLDTRTMPRFRSLAYFRKWDPTFEAMQLNPNILPPLYSRIAGSTVDSVLNVELALKHLKIVDLGGIFDAYDTEKVDVAYAAGGTIFIKSSTSLAQGKVGYYQYPMLDIAGVGAAYDSWIADNHPWAIIYHAEAAVFTTTGDMDRARELVRPSIPARDDPGGLVAQAVAAMRMSNVEVSGR